MTSCLVIRNPASRNQVAPSRLQPAFELARAAGWTLDVALTDRAGHATDIARAAVERGIDVIIVNGGDGTINEVINGIAGTDVALGVMPGGTANVWVKETRISREPLKAMRDIVHGERRRVDLGRAGDRYFLLMAGAGFDADVVSAISPRIKRRAGAAAYIIAGFVAVFRSRAVRARLIVDGERREEVSLYWLLASNTRSYGGLAEIMFRAEADDGLFDAGVMHRGGPIQMLFAAARLFTRRQEGSPNIDFMRARSIEIETPGIPVHIDGEPCGVTPMKFACVPAALTVIVPRGVTTPLFAKPVVAAADSS